MKEKSLSKFPKNVSLKSSTSNLFLNIIIILLFTVIIFMAYSLYVKLEGIWSKNKNEENAAASIIQLEVLNGCGISGVAEKFTNYLRQNNFDVVQTGNYFSYNIDNSIVIDRTGNIANAHKVAKALGINKKHVIQQLNDDYFLDVSLIIGKDYIHLKPIN